ncbi:hypothetical protein [uncultured Gimesia sp.]|uniref:hypothetical protein n=1 Tax=uncultured Gimesia sp. TaxID=1678688 RepID=UPI0030DCD778|tara:strand:+ start:317510 stop:318214 length:705 start_codon:yes stop_codon:yes gene_type:complete
MITAEDKDYQESKLIKQGKRNRLFPFDELAEWIKATYNTPVLNICYEVISPFKRPRLNVIFEFTSEAEKFRDGAFNYDSEKQDAISVVFKKILKRNDSQSQSFSQRILRKVGIQKYQTKNMFVIFTSFEMDARDEVRSQIKESEIDDLIKSMHRREIWQFSHGSFFFYTDDQVERARSDGTYERLADALFRLFKKYDEFDYFQRDSFIVEIDSKEKFDNNYQGNWFYYSRDHGW